LPIVHERGHLWEIHEGNVVKVSVGLAIQDDSRWEAFIAHTLRERFVIGALVVNLVTELSERYTILTLLIRLMFAFAL
jgi:hypothetical protein